MEELLGTVSPLSEKEEEFESKSLHWSLKWLVRIVAILLMVFSFMMESFGPVTSLIILFILVVPLEKIFPRHKGQPVRRKHWRLDINYALAAPAMAAIGGAFTIAIGILSLAWIPGLLINPYVTQLIEKYPTQMLWVSVLLFDFLVYWTHRFYHEIEYLWPFHAIHHSTEHLDWVSGFRAHPFDGSLIAPAFFFLVAAGFDPTLTGAIVVVQVILGLFLHANVNIRLRILHPIIMTPDFHHWHHSNHREAIWTNYSTFLPIWDIIFGTYYMPKERPHTYGIDQEVPDNIVQQFLMPIKGLGNPLRAIRHPIRSVKVVFKFIFKKFIPDMYKTATRKRGVTPFRAPDIPDLKL